MKQNKCNVTGWLSSIDMFSILPSSRITFKNKDVYSTYIGQIFTIIVIFSSMATFIYFGMNMFLHTSPKTTISENYKAVPDYLNITKDNLFIAFGMQNIRGSFTFDESIFIPKMSVILKNKTDIITETPVKLKLCENSDLPNNPDLYAYFLTNPIMGMFCIADYYPVEMQGSLDSVLFEFTRIWIEPCNNVTNNNTCKTNDEIANFFNNNSFYMSYVPSNVDTLNYETPFNQHGDFYNIMTNYEQKTSIFFYFQDTYINTDDGVIFESFSTKRILNKASDKAFFYPKKEGDPVLELFMQSGKVMISYERVYIKLQEVLAQTGGAIKMLLIFFVIIAKPIVHFRFYLDLGNAYFTYEYEEKNKVKKDPLKFGIFQYFYSFFKDEDSDEVRKKKIFNRSKDILSNNLSLSQILNKIVELEKLKFLLLDQNHLILFESIPKPIISEISHEKKLLSIKEKKISIVKKPTLGKWNENFFQQTYSPKRTNLKKAYKVIKEKAHKCDLDQRILELTNFSYTDHFFHNNNSEIFPNDPFKDFVANGSLSQNKENYKGYHQKILSKSIDEIKIDNNEPYPEIYINTESILKDLQTIKK